MADGDRRLGGVGRGCSRASGGRGVLCSKRRFRAGSGGCLLLRGRRWRRPVVNPVGAVVAWGGGRSGMVARYVGWMPCRRRAIRARRQHDAGRRRRWVERCRPDWGRRIDNGSIIIGTPFSRRRASRPAHACSGLTGRASRDVGEFGSAVIRFGDRGRRRLVSWRCRRCARENRERIQRHRGRGRCRQKSVRFCNCGRRCGGKSASGSLHRKTHIRRHAGRLPKRCLQTVVEGERGGSAGGPRARHLGRRRASLGERTYDGGQRSGHSGSLPLSLPQEPGRKNRVSGAARKSG